MGNRDTTNIAINGDVRTKRYTSIISARDAPGTANIAHVGNVLKVEEFALEVAYAGDNPVDLETMLSKYGIVNDLEKMNDSENVLLIQQQIDYDTALQLLREKHGKAMADNFVKNMRKASEHRSLATPGCTGIRDVKNGTQIILSNGNQSLAVGGETFLDVSQNPRIYLGAGDEKRDRIPVKREG